MRRTIVPVVLVAGLLFAGEAEGQDWRELVVRQLDHAGEMVRADGHTDANVLPRNQVIGVLEDGATSYVEIRLQQGVEYFFAGACDQDCNDLDLRLYLSEDFEEVASDVETDDVPLLSFKAPSDGAYLLGVDMADCDEEICYYGFRVFQK
jgi:hypothetical protein